MSTWTNARNNGWQTTADSRLTGVPGINDLIGGPEISNDQADDNKPGEPQEMNAGQATNFSL